jgi:superfamily II DNA or RNA helicase
MCLPRCCRSLGWTRPTRRLAPGSFAVVIVDEFHHAAASSYRRWLDHL